MKILSTVIFAVLICNAFGLNIVTQLLDRTQYNLQYKYGSAMTPLYVTIHNTANSATARNEASYLNTRQDNVYISFHWVVDNIEAIQLLPNNINGWHAGDGSGNGNMKSIAIEIAQSTNTNTNIKDQATRNGAELAAKLLRENGWGIDRLRKHQDWSGKYCPHDILDRVGWENFKGMVQSFLGLSSTGTGSTTTTTKWLNLSPSVTSWNIYPLSLAPVIGNEIAKLNPSQYGGLSYQILANPQTDVYTIQTTLFGKVNIYASAATSSSITTTRLYPNP